MHHDPRPVPSRPDTVFGMDLRAALGAAVLAAADAARARVGSGDPDAVDGVAVDALRRALASAPAALTVVAGEGEKDEAPMLHPGERFGTGAGPALDLVVDPVDGTRLAASGRPGAMAILAVAPSGAFADLGSAHYLDKLVHAGPDVGLTLRGPVAENLARLAGALGIRVEELRVAVQARPRNVEVAEAVARAGARVHAFEHGDIERVVHAVASGGSLDLLLGVGGAPEGLLEAAIVRAHGGVMLAALAPQSSRESERLAHGGHDATRVFDLDGLCCESAFVAIAPVTPCALGPAGATLVEVGPGPLAADLSG
ncbi:fructose-bisphosphatase class II [Agromyces sp. Soil535]|uniref:fructose-bisphosphatase class II n=1 Tax=Agromyces sp. Soil535 TaxID=1736390 RepID=UPI00138ED421|nr:fructose-bisphosphatase class II [Agromyces sp. Soil535]